MLFCTKINKLASLFPKQCLAFKHVKILAAHTAATFSPVLCQREDHVCSRLLSGFSSLQFSFHDCFAASAIGGLQNVVIFYIIQLFLVVRVGETCLAAFCILNEVPNCCRFRTHLEVLTFSQQNDELIEASPPTPALYGDGAFLLKFPSEKGGFMVFILFPPQNTP